MSLAGVLFLWNEISSVDTVNKIKLVFFLYTKNSVNLHIKCADSDSSLLFNQNPKMFLKQI